MDAKTFDKAKPSSRCRDEDRTCAPGRIADAPMPLRQAHPVLGGGRHRLVEHATHPTPARNGPRHGRCGVCIAVKQRWHAHAAHPHKVYVSHPDSSAEPNLEKVKRNKDQNVAYSVYHPISEAGADETGRVVAPRGSSTSADAVGKVAGMRQLQLQVARPFGGGNVDSTVEPQGYGDGYVLPASSRPLFLELKLPEAEPAGRRRAWAARTKSYQTGVLRSYRGQVGPAREGTVTVTHAGGRADVVFYADL